MALRRSSIRLKSISTGHTELNLLIDGFKQVRDTAKMFCKAQEETIKDLYQLSQKEQNEILAQTCKYLEDLSIQWINVQQEFVDNLKKVKCQFTCIRKEELEVDKLTNKLHSLKKEEIKMNKIIAKPKVTITEKKQCQVHLAETKELITSLNIDLKEKTKQCQLTKSKRIRDGLKQYAESFLHLSNKCNIIFQSFYKAAHHLPDPTVYSSSDQTSRNLDLTRVSVLETKDKIAAYNRLPFPSDALLNVSGYESPPPYSPNSSFTSPPVNSSFVSPPPPNQGIGFHQYDQVAPDMIRNLNINVAVPPSGACYQNIPPTLYEEQGAVGGHF
ncbi:uncharacterized protein LOC103512057 isoform X2 [Diaphorina citri]|uniref:Uncharacterized protein LOC103512057 isoform X1 n=1 Tax=Diaphorina citri TaxID=121845 RepID=A0A1S4EF32_DIACI|nr:uncharacterized protein LOC103512057 isoform X1 [Diaphorina citri]XP_026681450.1 uncharacterized protein LOC103512057 isoform X2 [Diaphorina citri]